MDFQVQGSVLIDGEWVSRPADVFQIMSRNQQREDTQMAEPTFDYAVNMPNLGILTKTVVESPVYSQIVPANIRHKDVDDIVLVGENFVHLKEIGDYGHLRHIATKSDFKGKILAAKVFGETRKVQVMTSERSPLLKRESVHRTRRSMTGVEDPTLPLEVIVLTLSTRGLMFLWAKDDSAGHTIFTQRTIQLPTAASRFNCPGQFLAIDPKCRAIAVAAPEGSFMLYRTKTMESWRRDMQRGRDEVPIIEETTCSIEGRVMHMDFLMAGGQGDDTHVVLLFILVHDGKMKVASYDWDLGNSLNVRPSVHRSVLDVDNRVPSLLIPSNRTTNFLLIHDQHISVCKGVLSGPPEILTSPMPAACSKPPQPGSNTKLSHWVQWDRAPRNPDFTREAFYVAREDGVILYVEHADGANPLEISIAGNWPYPIDTAFACLKADASEFAQSYPDVLIAGGFGNDGQLCKVGSWPKEYAFNSPGDGYGTDFSFVESMPSWAPLTDMCVARFPNIALPFDRTRSSLYVTHGKAPFGRISQLRRGLRALVEESFSGLGGSTGLWIIDHGSCSVDRDGSSVQQDFVTFIVNAPPETLVLRVTRTHEEGSFSNSSHRSTWDESAWETTEPMQDGPMRDAETVTASLINENYAVQVTHKEARILQRSDLRQISRVSFMNPLLRAATKPGLPFIVAAFLEGKHVVLRVLSIASEGSICVPEAATSYLLHREPTCIDIVVTDAGPIIFVGVNNCIPLFFKPSFNGALTRLPYDGAENDLTQTYESAVLLTAQGRQNLVCGTRDGLLVSSDLCVNNDSCSLSDTSVTRIGTTSVSLRSNKLDSSLAFASCGPDFCRIQLSHQPGVHVDSIWLEHPKIHAYSQGPVHAIDQVPLALAGRNSLDGFIFAISGDRMVFIRMDYDVKWTSQSYPFKSPEHGKVVPRGISVTGAPSKIFIAEDLPHHAIVVTNEIVEEKPPPNGYRTIRSCLRIADLFHDETSTEPLIKEEGAPGTPRNRLQKTEIQLKNYEKVNSMVRWPFLDGKGRQRSLIIVGTTITEAQGKESGRRLVLNFTKSGLDLQDKKKFEKPVRCIAVYDGEHIVSTIGNVLQLEQLERTDAARWKRRGHIHLPSPGVHMSVSGNFIHVSTSYDSHLCYEVTRLSKVSDELTFNIRQVSSDSRERASLRHLTFEVPAPLPPNPELPADLHATLKLSLLSDKSASLTGLVHPYGTKTNLTTHFEACLPRSVVRLERGNIRPPWRTPYTLDQRKLAGVLVDDIVGACTDGTMYSVYIIDTNSRYLLRLIQNLIEEKRKRDPILQFSTLKHGIHNLLQNGVEGSHDGLIKAREVNPELQEKGLGSPRLRHIDGDLLIRFFDQGGSLGSLVGHECDPDVTNLVLHAVRQLAIGTPLEQNFSGVGRIYPAEEERVKDKAFAWAEKWLQNVLMPLL